MPCSKKHSCIASDCVPFQPILDLFLSLLIQNGGRTVSHAEQIIIMTQTPSGRERPEAFLDSTTLHENYVDKGEAVLCNVYY